MPDRHVFLLRHGRTALNAAGRLRGHLDPPLDEVGQVQAYELAVALSYLRPVRILSSPLLRARQTAEPLGRHTSVRVELEPRLIDRDYGDWAGRTPEEVAAACGSLDAAPGVEPRSDVLARASAVLDEQRDHLDRGPVVLVAHDVVNRLLLASLDPSLGDPDDIRQRPACWNVLLRTNGEWRVEQVDQHC
jgi:broad specificity phosphatase PhoE